MSTAKKPIPEQNPESYRSKGKSAKLSIAEIISNRARLSYKINFKENEPDNFETDRLIIRHFKNDDWYDLQQITISKENSEFADCDKAWPTDVDSVKDITTYLGSKKQFWAVEVKSISKVVCFVNFNVMDENKTLDVGHVMNSDFFDNDYEFEALGVLYDYGFNYLNTEQIQAVWTLADRKKLEPLEKLGMQIVKTFMNPKFRDTADEMREEFESCTLMVTKDEWEKYRPIPEQTPESFNAKS